jgi:hypothetical protein
MNHFEKKCRKKIDIYNILIDDFEGALNYAFVRAFKHIERPKELTQEIEDQIKQVAENDFSCKLAERFPAP